MINFKLFYFLYFGAAAALFPYLVVYYEYLGLSPQQLALLVASLPLTTLVSAPLWGAAADATQKHRLLFSAAIIGSISIALLLPYNTHFPILWVLVILFAFFISPVMPLFDNATMNLLGSQKSQYGKYRLWGAIGWGAAAPIAGLISEYRGLRWNFYSFSILLIIGYLVSRPIALNAASKKSPDKTHLKSLFQDQNWISFLLLAAIGGIGFAIPGNYLFIHLYDLGATKTLLGLSLTVASISEIPVLFFSDRLIKRYSARNLFLAGLFILAVRSSAYSFIHNPWTVLPLQLLHGPTFSVLWIAGVTYANEISPKEAGATAQGIFSGVLLGLGGTLGGYLGGVLYRKVGLQDLFLNTGIALAAGIMIYMLLILLSKKTNRKGESHD